MPRRSRRGHEVVKPDALPIVSRDVDDLAFAPVVNLEPIDLPNSAVGILLGCLDLRNRLASDFDVDHAGPYQRNAKCLQHEERYADDKQERENIVRANAAVKTLSTITAIFPIAISTRPRH